METQATINRELFFDYLNQHVFSKRLNTSQRAGLNRVLEFWETNFPNRDERFLANVLDRISDSTAGTFCDVQQQPVHPGTENTPARKSKATFILLDDTRLQTFFSVRSIDLDSPLAAQFYAALTGIRHMSISEVLAEELRHNHSIEVSGKNLTNVFRTLHGQKLTALCFSGGGIRSATFGLGIAQALADNGLLEKFDYLSTVSGGGYLGSWLSAWIYREQLTDGDDGASKSIPPSLRRKLRPSERDLGVKEVQKSINCMPLVPPSPNPEPKQLQHLREYSNYMSPRVGILSADTWTLFAIYLRNLFLNLTIFLPLIAAVLIIPRFLFAATITPAPVWITLLISIVTGSFAITFVLTQLPSNRSKARADKQPSPEGVPDSAPQANLEAESDEGAAVEIVDKVTAAPDFKSADVKILLMGVIPLMLSAFSAACVWGWNYRLKNSPLAGFAFAGITFDAFDAQLVDFVRMSLLGYAAGVIFYLAFCLFDGFRRDGFAFFPNLFSSGVDGIKRNFLLFLFALLSTAAGGAILWIASEKVLNNLANTFRDNPWIDGFGWQIYLTFSVPLFLLVVLIAATLFVGLSSARATDEDREWLARYGAWVIILCGVWIVANTVVLLGPSVFHRIYDFDWRAPLSTLTTSAVISTLVGIVSALVSLFGGFSEKSLVRNEPVRSRSSRILEIAPRIAAVVFLTFIFVGLAHLTTHLLYAISGPFGSLETSAPTDVLYNSPVLLMLAAFLILGAVGTIMAFFVNVNKFSLHGAYRDRLVRAYLGASNTRRSQDTFTGFDDSDNFQQHRLKDQKPFHVINATLNLIGGKNLAWQNRKAASFTMSPLHCGSWTLGYRRTNEFCRNENLGACKNIRDCNQLLTVCGTKADGAPDCKFPGKALRLGTAMAISGAAANPNMGYYSSPVVTFLMSLFNIRLGWWLGNTGPVGSNKDWFGTGRVYFTKHSPSIAVLPLLNETLGRTDEYKRYVNVTDGGHFENLALYEMVLRRCRLIVLSDGAADEAFKFGEIANAIQKCKVDLGVDIQFIGSMNIRARTDEREKKKNKLAKSRFAIARIQYPEKFTLEETDPKTGKKIKKEVNYTGWLVYTRPTYYQTEPRDIINYAESNLKFPHQSTGDQMYDEKQFEAYRALGFYTMSEIREIFQATAMGDPENKVDQDLEDLFKEEPQMEDTLFNFFDLHRSGVVPDV